jgi:aminotransferase
MVYDGLAHISPATLPGMRERTVIVNGLSKTYSVTGWRVGYVIAPPVITNAIRKVHDFLTVGAAAPLQAAGATAVRFPDSYYEELCDQYRARRDLMLEILTDAGLRPFVPHGAYYVMCDISGFPFDSDVDMSRFLVEEVGIAVVPGSSFFSRPELGRRLIRFAFPKRLETLERARARLATLSEPVGQPAG